MIPKSGYRFLDKIMLNEKNGFMREPCPPASMRPARSNALGERVERHQRAAFAGKFLASVSNPIRVLTNASNSRSGTMLGPSDGA